MFEEEDLQRVANDAKIENRLVSSHIRNIVLNYLNKKSEEQNGTRKEEA